MIPNLVHIRTPSVHHVCGAGDLVCQWFAAPWLCYLSPQRNVITRETALLLHLSHKRDLPTRPFSFFLSSLLSRDLYPTSSCRFKREMFWLDGAGLFIREPLPLLRPCRIRIQCKRRWRPASVIWSLSGVAPLVRSTKGEQCTIICQSRF
jgi:hypothetical protein